MTNIAKVKAAQTRAKKHIKHFESLGYTVKDSIKDRANMKLPKSLSDKQARAIVDNLSLQTIRVTSRINTEVTTSKATPIVRGTYKSGAPKFDVSHIDRPIKAVKNISFSKNEAIKKAIKEINFVMDTAPSIGIAEEIERKLWAIELHSGKPIFKSQDRDFRVKALTKNMLPVSEIEKAISAAEKKGFPAAEAITNMYAELLEEYGDDFSGAAAHRFYQEERAREAVGINLSTDPKERIMISDVLDALREYDEVWQGYRQYFKLHKYYRQIYDSDSLLVDVSQAMLENEEFMPDILNSTINYMRENRDPAGLADYLERTVDELIEERENAQRE